MAGTRVMMAILAIAIVVGGFTAGRLFAQLAAPAGPAASTPPASQPPVILPDRDVFGRDVPGLPRHPGAVRTGFDRREGARTVVTTVSYAVRAERNEVRAFYVEAFHEKRWEMVDLQFSGRTWTFVVVRGARQATVEVVSETDVIQVLVEVTRRLPDPTPKPTPKPEQPAPPPPPPDDDDDGDDDRDDDGDDGDDSDDGAGGSDD